MSASPSLVDSEYACRKSSMPPSPPALARIASTSERGPRVDAALRDGVPSGVREKARRQFLVGQRERRPKQRCWIGRFFKAIPFQVRSETAIILFACGRSGAVASRCLGQSETCYKGKIDLLKQQIFFTRIAVGLSLG